MVTVKKSFNALGSIRLFCLSSTAAYADVDNHNEHHQGDDDDADDHDEHPQGDDQGNYEA